MINQSRPNGAKNIDQAWHNTVQTVQYHLRHSIITGPGLQWESSHRFQQRFYTLLAAWVGNCPEHVMVTQVSYGSWLRFEIPTGVRTRYSTFRPLDFSREQPMWLELLRDTNIDALHTLGVHPICNQF